MSSPSQATEKVRIDRWMWAVRLFKTRSDAASACKGGKVEINRRGVKPSAPVRVGDVVTAKVGQWQREVVVEGLITRRVGAKIAAEYYLDRSEPRPSRDPRDLLSGRRDRGSGKPTNRERRAIQRAFGHRK